MTDVAPSDECRSTNVAAQDSRAGDSFGARGLKACLRIGSVIAVIIATVFAGHTPIFAEASGQETVGRYTYWLPENIFPASSQIDTLFYFILYLTCAICVAVFIALIAFLIKYRHKPGRHATFIKGNSKLELVWTLIPTLILAITAVISQTTWSRMKTPPALEPGDDVVRVEVIGRQFKWFIRYPGQDGVFGPRRTELIDPLSSETDELIGLDRSHPDAKDDIVSVNLLYVPVDKRVFVDLISVDVLHSFYLPYFRVKQDAVPGLNGRVWFEASKTSAQVIGTTADGENKPFDIVCAELCGQGHYTMRGLMYVVTQDEYDAFLEEEASYLDLGGDDEEYDEY